MDKQTLQRAVRFFTISAAATCEGRFYIPAAVSNKHLHLSKQDAERLFGAGYEFHPKKALAQHGQFACEETLDFCGPKGTLRKIRILGPMRAETQIELSVTDCYQAGITPVIRMSGDIQGTPGGRLIGPAGEITVDRGVLVAARHLHASTEQATVLRLADKETICLRKKGIRGAILQNVQVRVRPDFELELHIDTDEANACMIANGDLLEIVR